MEAISSVFDMLDVRGALTEGYREKRKYEQQDRKTIVKPKSARFKLMMYFWDGGRFIGYSLDRVTHPETGERFTDEFAGLSWLINYIRIELSNGTVKTAQIYWSNKIYPDTDTKHYEQLVYQLTPNYEINVADIHCKVEGADTRAIAVPFIKKVIKKRQP